MLIKKIATCLYMCLEPSELYILHKFKKWPCRRQKYLGCQCFYFFKIIIIIDFVSQIVCGNAAGARCQARSFTSNLEQGLFYPGYFENEALVLG